MIGCVKKQHGKETEESLASAINMTKQLSLSLHTKAVYQARSDINSNLKSKLIAQGANIMLTTAMTTTIAADIERIPIWHT